MVVAACLLGISIPLANGQEAPTGGSQASQNMQTQANRAGSLRSRIAAGNDKPLQTRHEADLELRAWTIEQSLEAAGQPKAPTDLAGRIETAITQTEALLDAFDRGQDQLAGQRGMVVRGFRAPGQDHPQPYGIHVPQGYDPARAWPLFIYLHGGGRIEQDRFALDRLAPPTPASQPATQPAAPAGAPLERMLKIWLPRRGGNWAEAINEQSVFAAIEHVKANYNVDVNRIYVQGFSLGGFATVHYAVRFPDVFAGAGPSGMTSDYDVLPLAENLGNLPMYLCHGTLDDVCDVQTTRRLFDRLRELRCDAVFQEEVRIRHQTTDLARAAQEAWLLARPRNPQPDKVVYVTDNPRYHRAYWVDIVQCEPLAEKAVARIEAVREGPGRFTVHTQRVASFAILLDEAIAPAGKDVTVSVNGQPARTYGWPTDGRIVVQVAPASGR